MDALDPIMFGTSGWRARIEERMKKKAKKK